mgnify:CR=1 FL=1
MKIKNVSNVLLIGIGGVYNYGCEAIIRGTVKILREQFPNIRISYASYNYLYDKRRLADCDLVVIDRTRRKKFIGRRIVRKVLSYINIRIMIPYDSLRFVRKNKFDAVFSIGGDIYTLGPGGEFNKALPQFCEKCQRIRLKYILFGASVGPFDKNKRAEIFFRNHLHKADLIVARENRTINYLSALGISQNVVFAPDPAFFVGSEITKKPNLNSLKRILAINISPLSCSYFYSDMGIALKVLSTAIIDILKKSIFNIVFVPHVFAIQDSDNDFLFMTKIINQLPAELNHRVSIISEDEGFISLKKKLVEFDFLLAVRMHCAINGVSAGLPTIFLYYSDKAKGMTEIVYGDLRNLISLNKLPDVDKLLELLQETDFHSNVDEIKQFNFQKIFDI